jgi:predicted DCC family thiol-disulfide oxidoreductase YuxK
VPDAADHRPVVLYDHDCGFCRWSLAKLLAWDRRRALRPAPIEGEEGRRLLAGMAESERLASWHLVDDDGVHSGGAAFAPALRRLPGGRPLAALAERLPGLTARGYGLVAGNRSFFGRRLSEGAKRRADRRIAARASRRD